MVLYLSAWALVISVLLSACAVNDQSPAPPHPRWSATPAHFPASRTQRLSYASFTLSGTRSISPPMKSPPPRARRGFARLALRVRHRHRLLHRILNSHHQFLPAPHPPPLAAPSATPACCIIACCASSCEKLVPHVVLCRRLIRHVVIMRDRHRPRHRIVDPEPHRHLHMRHALLPVIRYGSNTEFIACSMMHQRQFEIPHNRRERH